MEDKPTRRKISLKLNIFDIVIICLALAAAAVFYFAASGGDTSNISASSSTVRYTIEIDNAQEGTGALIEIGDELNDNVKNYAIGSVASVEFSQAVRSSQNSISGGYVDSPLPKAERITIIVEAQAAETDRNITVGGGYVIRAGTSVSITGPGYAGSGYITHVERSDDK